VIKGARWLIANSRDTKALIDVWDIPYGRIKIVHPPIAEEVIRRSSNMEPATKNGNMLKLVTLCRVVHGKGIDIVLRALGILDTKGIPYQYIIGGDGDERKFLESLIDQLGLRSRVRFVGSVTGDDKWSILQNSDVFVMPSRVESTWAESFGIAFIEAAAFGLPSIGSRTGGISDAVVDGETGILVPPESPKDVLFANSHCDSFSRRDFEECLTTTDGLMVSISNVD
jgi:phosphatidylinositol alpha-1,6-mannosyltransferase